MRRMNHPVAMFEIMALDQTRLISFYQELFGWHVELSPEGFGYIHFPPSPPAERPMLGGIGKAKAGVPGWEKGTALYVLVENVADALARAERLGATIIVPSKPVDHYVFGMFEDPEKNLLGLIEPFKS